MRRAGLSRRAVEAGALYHCRRGVNVGIQDSGPSAHRGDCAEYPAAALRESVALDAEEKSFSASSVRQPPIAGAGTGRPGQ